jgi:hypothetical protein
MTEKENDWMVTPRMEHGVACLFGMTGSPARRGTVATKSFCLFAITFENRYIVVYFDDVFENAVQD